MTKEKETFCRIESAIFEYHRFVNSNNSAMPSKHCSKPILASSFLRLSICASLFSSLLLFLSSPASATSIYVVEVEKAGTEYAAFDCKRRTGGPFPDPDDCSVYHHCMFGRDFTQNCTVLSGWFIMDGLVVVVAAAAAAAAAAAGTSLQ